jgi:hypothetical protein
VQCVQLVVLTGNKNLSFSVWNMTVDATFLVRTDVN